MAPQAPRRQINANDDPVPEGKKYSAFLIDEVMPFIKDVRSHVDRSRAHRHWRIIVRRCHQRVHSRSAPRRVRSPCRWRARCSGSTRFQLIADAPKRARLAEMNLPAVGTNEDSRPGRQRVEAARRARHHRHLRSDGDGRAAHEMPPCNTRDSTPLDVVCRWTCATHTAGAWACLTARRADLSLRGGVATPRLMLAGSLSRVRGAFCSTACQSLRRSTTAISGAARTRHDRGRRAARARVARS